MNCGYCLMEKVEIVALLDGVCPDCGAYAEGRERLAELRRWGTPADVRRCLREIESKEKAGKPQRS